ncbi:ABC transporter permease [Enterococcus canis]|uniref:ABC transporter permease n=1 Tax=Enterococcus canis TaxID=214095 RepID=A0A1L8RED0_9ENTE|nr:YfhO family protein [Enterococcus canis]OJG18097.1 ABC transporter permease [Enterococcus canis]
MIRNFLKKERLYMALSFFIPLVILAGIYLSIGIYPGSDRSILASDAFSQFSNFHASFHNMLHGKQSLFYSWNASLGLNYLALISYYLGGLFTPLVFFFSNQLMPDALYVLTLLKVGSAGLAFWFYARHTFKIPKLGHVTLSVCYALMSFVIAHSEIIMWLDTFVYLPLIIWGIDRILTQRKPTLLFVSYLLLFLSSFYMGFMVGVFSFLYFFLKVAVRFKETIRQVPMYLITSLLAGGASMIIILPAVLDLRTNGEELTKITTLKTAATSFWDIIMKNMVAVYDTTKYGSIPFIYVGLLPLVLCVFFFVQRRINWRDKLVTALLFGILIASFYLTPLNLFWHGMHAPNMFLFRYSFLFSFLVVMTAGYGWQSYQRKDLLTLSSTILLIMAAFALAIGTIPKNSYDYIDSFSMILTFVFLALYLASFVCYQLQKLPLKQLALVLLLIVSAEAIVNTNGMVHGILDDWNYASRSLYTDPYPDIKKLVDQRDPAFSRLENLDPVSANDGFNYGYSGISMFSSIRNRNSSGYLNELGFRSRGTNLNIRYPNNTLPMDSLFGVRYNISKSNPQKFGFTEIAAAGDYHLYENQYALPLAFTVPETVYDAKALDTDNLGSQTDLLNHLTGTTREYYQFATPQVTGKENTEIVTTGNQVTYKEQAANKAKEITWEVHVPKDTQAYLSLFPTNFNELESSTVTITVNGIATKSQINITGQYYNLGSYDTDTTVTFTASFYGTSQVSFVEPKVLLLNLNDYTATMQQLQQQAADLQVAGRKAEGSVTLAEDGVLFTTIPYDKGWRAYVDGQEVAIKDFEGALVTLPLTKGTHEVRFVFLPQGFTLGALLFVLCLALFIFYQWWLRRKATTQIEV